MLISTETRSNYTKASWTIFRLLRDAGIARNGQWTEYEKAKQLLKPDEIKDLELRDLTYQAITDWVRV